MNIETSKFQNISRYNLAIFMILAGLGHLTINRLDFQAQVPNWLPFNKDFVVIASGLIEISFGITLAFWKSKRNLIGWLLALFFVLIFPGNIAQYVNGIDAFGVLNSDKARLIRLFFQPVLVIWALWSSGAWQNWRAK
jgi:uncharacterized membrane protein